MSKISDELRSPPAGVRVKGLGKWRRGYCDEQVTIEQASFGGLYQVRVLNGVVNLDWPDRSSPSVFGTAEEAKAAAEADYRQRILSAIEPQQEEAVAATEPDMSQGWLIHKAGRGWYRPNAQGYTNDTSQAGRYSREDADAYSHPNGWDGPRDEITIRHESELPAHPTPVQESQTVTDEMVERFGRAFWGQYWLGTEDDMAQVRAALTAALAPS